MTVTNNKTHRTKQIALLIVFTALYVVLRNVPYSILIGSAGGFLYLSDFLVAIYGIILGPYFGGLSVILGNFAAIGLGHHVSFLGFDFLPDFVAVVTIGFLYQRKWSIAVAINAIVLVMFAFWPLTSFFVTIPGTSIVLPFAWMHIAAFVILISPLGRWVPKWVETAKPKFVAAGIAIMAFVGAMVQHLTGNILFEIVFGQMGTTPIIPKVAWPAEWAAVALIYPLERTLLIICAIAVGVPLILTLTRNHFIKPRQQEALKTERSTSAT